MKRFIFIRDTESRDNALIEKYEQALCQYFSVKYCLAVSSGTAALTAALHAVGVSPGNKIVLSPAAPLCTAYPVLYHRADPHFSDINEADFGLQLHSIDATAGLHPAALIEVPMWGYGIDAEKISNWSKERKVPLIFDLAHCVGTRYKDVHLPAFCDIACFSTQKNKIFSTGEGGFLVTNNEAYYLKALLYCRMGNLSGVDYGVNFKISHFQAAEGLKEAARLPENLSRRSQNAQYIKKNTTNRHVSPFYESDCHTASYHRLIVMGGKSPGQLAYYMHDNGIQSDIIKYNVKPLYEYPIFEKHKTHCPNTERVLNYMTTIPVHYQYAEHELNTIARILNDFNP